MSFLYSLQTVNTFMYFRSLQTTFCDRGSLGKTYSSIYNWRIYTEIDRPSHICVSGIGLPEGQ